MPVFGPKTTREEIAAFNEYLKRSREERYTPEQLAEMQAAVDGFRAAQENDSQGRK